jgi:hypothetical protein
MGHNFSIAAPNAESFASRDAQTRIAETLVFPIRDIAPKVVLNVRLTGVRSWKIRTTLALWLFRIVAWPIALIGRVDVDVEVRIGK